MEQTGESIKTLNALNPELDDGAAAASGNIIDRLAFDSAVFTVAFGATTGTPTSIDYVFKLEHGDASDLSDATDLSGATVSSDTDPSAGDVVELNVDLEPAKRYIRFVATGTYVGGTTPTVGIAATGALGESKTGPV